jgi:NADPH:quinone reductase-like Zn-dependent oxidoreductase
MKAAVISAANQAPRYLDVAEPRSPAPGELLVDVLAVGLHHLTRSRATGAHYSSRATFPLVPGMDGVGRDRDGKLRYFVLDDTQLGSLADKTVIQLDRSIVLPSEVDPVAVAAAMNPAMGPWLALRKRISFEEGQRVLILGATGSAGSMAVQIARQLRASQIIAVGRDARKLAKLQGLGATDVVRLGEERIGALAREVDVVLDLIWGDSAAELMLSLIRQRADRSRPLTWIQIGSVSGPTASIPAAALRSANFRIIGSGIGSVSGREILQELPALVKEIAGGTLRIDAKPVPLSDVERAWAEVAHTSERIVLTP